LWVLVALGSWVFSDLRAPVSSTVDAVDASSSMVAVGDTQVTAEMAGEMWRSRCRKGGYVRMLSTVDSIRAQMLKSSDPIEQVLAEVSLFKSGDTIGERPTDTERARSRLVGKFARGQKFVERLKYRVKPGTHINLKEARAVASAVRRDVGKVSSQGKRVVKLSDSMVNVRAWAKGRSSSRALNAVLRRSTVDQVWGGVYVGLLHVPTEDNALDDPTRGKEVREKLGPIVCSEEWREQWAQLCEPPPHHWYE